VLNFGTKLLAAAIIFIIAIVCGFFPLLLKTTDREKRWLLHGESFAGGVFLGAGLIHLLPDAAAAFSNFKYPFAFLICAISILFLRFIEEGTSKLFRHRHKSPQICLACLLTVVLSVHSIFEGTALGIETTLASFLVILVAILAHKGAEAFSLGISLRKSEMPKKILNTLVISFSLMTPVGILLGAFIIEMFHSNQGTVTVGIFDAIAAGTFIYIAAFHSVHMNGDDDDVSPTPRLFYFAIGLLVMAMVAVWV
jgi:zinc transporter 1/2/3